MAAIRAHASRDPSRHRYGATRAASRSQLSVMFTTSAFFVPAPVHFVPAGERTVRLGPTQ